MKIRDVEAIALDIPLRKVFGGSKYTVPKRCTVVTRIRTDDGLVSEVYNGDDRDHSPQIVKIVVDELAPLIAGEDATRLEFLWQRMARLAEEIRNRHLVMQAIACVDTALWDLLGKAAGMNVARLQGAYRDTIGIISIGGYYEEGKTLADVGREMEFLRSEGMAGCKFKVGGLSPEEDARRVAAAREGGGPDFVLAVDANRAWNVADAARFARLIEPYDIAWFEEPCHWYDDETMLADLRYRTTIPLTAGQSEIDAHGIRRLLDARAVDLVNFDASEGGGPTAWRRAALASALHGARMAHHEEPQIAMQLLSAVAHGTYVECFADPERDPIWQHMILNRPAPVDGTIAVPQGPGFGLELDAAMIVKYRST